MFKKNEEHDLLNSMNIQAHQADILISSSADAAIARASFDSTSSDRWLSSSGL